MATDRRKELLIVLIASIWYAFTAYFSLGYQHGDEHYQVIEFAGTLDRTHTGTDLAWEYAARARSSLQPVIAHVVFSACERVSLTDPYNKTFILRLLTGLVAVFCIHRFAWAVRPMVRPANWIAFLVLSNFLWFIPFISVRFSSETWSGLLVLLAMTLTLREDRTIRTQAVIGLLLGTAFLFRYQSCIATSGLLLWMLFVRKHDPRRMLSVLLPMLLVLACGVSLDSWFYGELVLAPWNYVKAQLIDGVASEYGTSPWYYYPYFVFRSAFFPFGIAIIAAGAWFMIIERRHAITWVVVPYLVVHTLIAHKELRFLLPLVYFVPLVLIWTVQRVQEKSIASWAKPLFRPALFLLYGLNLIGLVAASLKPADVGRMRITQHLHQQRDIGPINLISCRGSNPYDPWGGLVAKFYLDTGTTFTDLQDLQGLSDLDLSSNSTDYLVLKAVDVDNVHVRSFVQKNGMRPIMRSMPEYLTPILHTYGGFPMKDVLVLYGEEH